MKENTLCKTLYSSGKGQSMNPGEQQRKYNVDLVDGWIDVEACGGFWGEKEVEKK